MPAVREEAEFQSPANRYAIKAIVQTCSTLLNAINSLNGGVRLNKDHLIRRCRLKVVQGGDRKCDRDIVQTLSTRKRTLRGVNGCDKLNPDKAFNRRHQA